MPSGQGTLLVAFAGLEEAPGLYRLVRDLVITALL